MQCPNCGKEVAIRREFCPKCGQRIEVSFDQILSSVKEDAAERRGVAVDTALLRVAGALFLLGIVIWGANSVWSRPLVYSGADLPSLEPPAVPEPSVPRLGSSVSNPQKLEAPPAAPPRAFGYRAPPLRDQLRDLNGGSAKTTAGIRRALDYMLQRQRDTGSWPVTFAELRMKKDRDQTNEHQWHQTGLTSLVLLACLGEGHSPREAGGYGDALRRGLSYLLRGQDEVNGRFGPRQGLFMLNHAPATLAVAEAAGVSGDPFLRAAAQKGVDLIERAQGDLGGWGVTDELGEAQNTEVSAWMVQALLAAREAGLEVKDQSLRRAQGFFRKMTDENTGRVVVDNQTDTRQWRLDLVGASLIVRRRLGESGLEPVLRLMARRLNEALPRAEKGWGTGWDENQAGVDHTKRANTFIPQTWLPGAYAMFYMGGEDWCRTGSVAQNIPPGWNEALVSALLDLQDHDGAWRPNDLYTAKYGALHATALAVLALQVHYRTP